MVKVKFQVSALFKNVGSFLFMIYFSLPGKI